MKYRVSRVIAILLWILSPLPLVAQAVLPPEIAAATKFADVAAGKDALWLSLAITGGAISFSAWLVNRGMKLMQAGHEAQLRVAEEIHKLSEKISKANPTNE